MLIFVKASTIITKVIKKEKRGIIERRKYAHKCRNSAIAQMKGKQIRGQIKEGKELQKQKLSLVTFNTGLKAGSAACPQNTQVTNQLDTTQSRFIIAVELFTSFSGFGGATAPWPCCDFTHV